MDLGSQFTDGKMNKYMDVEMNKYVDVQMDKICSVEPRSLLEAFIMALTSCLPYFTYRHITQRTFGFDNNWIAFTQKYWVGTNPDLKWFEVILGAHVHNLSEQNTGRHSFDTGRC